MRHDVEDRNAEADANLIEANQLGATLGVFRLQPGLVRSARLIGIGLLGIGMLFLLISISDSFFSWQRYLTLQQDPTRAMSDSLAMQNLQTHAVNIAGSLFMGLFLFSLGLLTLWVVVPQRRRGRIIVCERGFLRVARKIRSDSVDIVRWEDIRKMKRPFRSHNYIIERREGEAIPIDTSYQDTAELADLVRQHIDERQYIGYRD